MKRAFTGRDMTVILIGGFGVVIAVNLLMATLAVRTFGGLVVENSYVASQKYNRWLDAAEKQKALGWTIATKRTARDLVIVETDGVPAEATITALAQHPLGRAPDVVLTFRREGIARFLSNEALPPGRWLVRYEISANAGRYRTEANIP